MTRQTDTDWITEGAKVVELSINYSGGSTGSPATIAKLTKTQIVLDNDHRYRRDTLRLVGEKGGVYSGRREVCAAGDPRVVDAAARAVVSNLLYRISKLHMRPTDGQDRAVEVLDEIDRTMAAARRAITEEK